MLGYRAVFLLATVCVLAVFCSVTSVDAEIVLSLRQSENIYRGTQPAPAAALDLQGAPSPPGSTTWYLSCQWLRWDPVLGDWDRANTSVYWPVEEDGKVHLIDYHQLATWGPDVVWDYQWYATYLLTNGELHVNEGMPPPEPPCPVEPDDKALKGDPVNVITRHMVHDELDVFVPAPGIPLELRRSYNSGSTHGDGPLGPRWIHSYEWQLFPTSVVARIDAVTFTNRSVIVRTGEGKPFTLPEASLYGPGPGLGLYKSYRNQPWVVSEQANGDFVLNERPGLMSYRFDSNGLLRQISDRWGRAVTLTYAGEFPWARLTRVEHSNGQFLELGYDGNRLTSVTTISTNLSMAYAYDDRGQLTNATRIVSGERASNAYVYDSTGAHRNHSMLRRINPAGHTFEYTYATNASGGVLSECTGVLVASNYYGFAVDYSGYRTSGRYERGDVVQTNHYEYDPRLLRLTREVGPGPNSVEKSYSYDGFSLDLQKSRLEIAETGEWLEVGRTFDEYHHPRFENFSYCTPSGETWEYLWSEEYGLPTLVIDPQIHAVGFHYTNGSVTQTEIHFPGGKRHKAWNVYGDGGLLVCVTNLNGHWTRYGHDQFGRVDRIEPEAGPPTVVSNNTLGFVEQIIRPGRNGPRLTDLDIDPLGRVKCIAYPDGRSEAMAYDALGNVTNHIDAAGRATRYTYAPAKKLTSVSRTLSGTVPEPITTQFAYDKQFNTLRIIDPRGRAVESYVLDMQDRPVVVTNLEGQAMAVQYGIGDFVKSISRFDGTVVSNEFDSGGRVARSIYPGVTNAFLYLRNGLLRSASCELGAVTNDYYYTSRPITSRGIGPNSRVDYTYCPMGQVSNVTSVSGTTKHEYDAAERIARIASPCGVFEYAYDANNGLAASVTCTNTGVELSLAYDVVDRVTNLVWRDDGDRAIRSFAYTYDLIGMITNVLTESGERVTYEYDSLDRLIGERRSCGVPAGNSTETYSYDAAGNRRGKTHGGLSVAYSHTNGNRLASWSATRGAGVLCVDLDSLTEEGADGTCAYDELWAAGSEESPLRGMVICIGGGLTPQQGTPSVLAVPGVDGVPIHLTNSAVFHVLDRSEYLHNAAGCVTNVVMSGGEHSRSISLDWDSQYRLKSVSIAGEVAEVYGYDALGRRVFISDGVITNWLVYDGAHVVAEVDSDGSLKRSYTYGPGIDNILAMGVFDTATNTYYFIRDHLGSPVAVIDEQAQVVEQYRYDALGRVNVYDGEGGPVLTSQIGSRHLFQGREYSWATGLYYFRARWYDPVTGRWLSKDPIGISGGLNQYVFCGNNPVNFVDPSGLWQFSIAGGWGLAGELTFGRNSGRWNVGFKAGLGAGIAGGIVLTDSGQPHASQGLAARMGFTGQARAAVGPIASVGGAVTVYGEGDMCGNDELGWLISGNADTIGVTETYGINGVLRWTEKTKGSLRGEFDFLETTSYGWGAVALGGIEFNTSW